MSARPSSYDELLDRVRELAAGLDRPPVVAIGGHGGAGKTTLARRLAHDLGLDWEQVVRLDRTYAARDARGDGLFSLHDWPVLLDLLARVRARPTPARLAHATRQYDGREGAVDVPMPGVLLVEGIRLLRAETLPLLDLAVWLDLDPETAGERAKARNVLQGDSREELELWDTRWVPEGRDYQRVVRPERLAHLVVTPDSLI